MQPLQCETTVFEYPETTSFIIFQAFFKRGSRIGILSNFDRFLVIWGLHLETLGSTFEGHFFRSQKSQNVSLGSDPGSGLSWTHPGEGGNWEASGPKDARKRI